MYDRNLTRLHACILAGVPCIYWGPPGVGKTTRVAAYVKARDGHNERWLLSRCEPIDIKQRVAHDGRVVVSYPEEYERAGKAAVSGIVSVLFFDELNRASRETEGAALDLIDSPPPGVSIVVACNPPSRGQSARSLNSATANRFCHLDVEIDHLAFASAQIGGWGASKADFPTLDADAFAKADSTARAILSAFIRAGGLAKLEAEPTNPVAAGRPWPSPRSWENARRLYAVALALNLDTDDTAALIGGCVGAGLAVEYLTFARDMDLPDPEVLLANPKGYSPPRDRTDKTVAALGAVAGAIEREFTEPRWQAAWQIIQACEDAQQLDAALVGGDMLASAYKRLGERDKPRQKSLTPTSVVMPDRMARILLMTSKKAA